MISVSEYVSGPFLILAFGFDSTLRSSGLGCLPNIALRRSFQRAAAEGSSGLLPNCCTGVFLYGTDSGPQSVLYPCSNHGEVNVSDIIAQCVPMPFQSVKQAKCLFSLQSLMSRLACGKLSEDPQRGFLVGRRQRRKSTMKDINAMLDAEHKS
jgi:hypothetical protein